MKIARLFVLVCVVMAPAKSHRLPNTFRVWMYDDSTGLASMGTGSAIWWRGRVYYLTARHVVAEGVSSDARCVIGVGPIETPCKVERTCLDDDIAIIVARLSDLVVPVRADLDKLPAEGSVLTITGWTPSGPGPIHLQTRMTSLEIKPGGFLVPGTVARGMSGSAVLHGSSWIGMVQGVVGDAETGFYMTYIAAGDRIRQCLTK